MCLKLEPETCQAWGQANVRGAVQNFECVDELVARISVQHVADMEAASEPLEGLNLKRSHFATSMELPFFVAYLMSCFVGLVVCLFVCLFVRLFVSLFVSFCLREGSAELSFCP